jgi:hypothetical protein
MARSRSGLFPVPRSTKSQWDYSLMLEDAVKVLLSITMLPRYKRQFNITSYVLHGIFALPLPRRLFVRAKFDLSTPALQPLDHSLNHANNVGHTTRVRM